MKILITTDGSNNGLNAVQLGGTIANKLEAKVTLLCATSGKIQEVENALQRTTQAMDETGATYILANRHGELIEEILTQILATEYDLVVVGYQARSFLEKMIWGSLATRLVYELPATVLVVRERHEWIKHVLIGISGGGFTNECSLWGGRIAEALGADVTLLHVSTTPPLMYGGLEEVVETLPEFLQADTPNSQAIKQASAQLTTLNIPTKIELAHGLPEREFLRVAQEVDADLLVIGCAWAAPSIRRFFMRNVTEKILLNTQRPVLVVRPMTQT